MTKAQKTHSYKKGTAFTKPRVVIVGGGFGGLYAARALAGAPVSVTLIDSATTTSSGRCYIKPLLAYFRQTKFLVHSGPYSAAKTTSTFSWPR